MGGVVPFKQTLTPAESVLHGVASMQLWLPGTSVQAPGGKALEPEPVPCPIAPVMGRKMSTDVSKTPTRIAFKAVTTPLSGARRR